MVKKIGFYADISFAPCSLDRAHGTILMYDFMSDSLDIITMTSTKNGSSGNYIVRMGEHRRADSFLQVTLLGVYTIYSGIHDHREIASIQSLMSGPGN